jgi:hypothetical protein
LGSRSDAGSQSYEDKEAKKATKMQAYRKQCTSSTNSDLPTISKTMSQKKTRAGKQNTKDNTIWQIEKESGSTKLKTPSIGNTRPCTDEKQRNTTASTKLRTRKNFRSTSRSIKDKSEVGPDHIAQGEEGGKWKEKEGAGREWGGVTKGVRRGREGV